MHRHMNAEPRFSTQLIPLAPCTLSGLTEEDAETGALVPHMQVLGRAVMMMGSVVAASSTG